MPRPSTIKGILAFAGGLPGIDTTTLREGLEIANLHHRVEVMVENDLAKWGLTARQVEILESLFHNPDGVLTPADLSEEVGLTRSAMTSALDSLEKFEYIVRKPHPSDRRMVAIHLTPAGRRFISQRLPLRYQRIFRIMDGLTTNERSILLCSYMKVIEYLSTEAAGARR